MNKNYIKGRIYTLGLTQETLAKKMGVSRVWVSGVINGKTNPTIKTLEKFADALGCKVKDLL